MLAVTSRQISDEEAAALTGRDRRALEALELEQVIGLDGLVAVVGADVDIDAISPGTDRRHLQWHDHQLVRTRRPRQPEQRLYPRARLGRAVGARAERDGAEPAPDRRERYRGGQQ